GGAKKQPRSRTGLVSQKLMRPGWPVAHRLGRSSSRMCVIRVIETITPPHGAVVPPMSPVPEPRGTIGTRALRQSRTIACTSSVLVGRTTASGAALYSVSMSLSYVRRPSGVSTTPAGPSRRSSPATTLAESATAGCRLADLPGVARDQKLRDAPRPSVGDGALLLLEYDLLVDRRLDRLEHADRHRK